MPKLIRYVGPFADGIEVAETGQWLPRGEPVEVDDAIAGRAPAEDGSDPGEGLLAQVANFVEAGAGTPTVASVLDSVGDDRDKAAAALALEQARGASARKTLVERLEAIVNREEQSGA